MTTSRLNYVLPMSEGNIGMVSMENAVPFQRLNPCSAEAAIDLWMLHRHRVWPLNRWRYYRVL